MTENQKLQIEEKVIKMLKTVYDPDMPINIYDLGLIYRIDIDDACNLELDMTFTSPTCPASDFIIEDVRQKLDVINELKEVKINIVFEPEWDRDMMSEEALLEMGWL